MKKLFGILLIGLLLFAVSCENPVDVEKPAEPGADAKNILISLTVANVSTKLGKPGIIEETMPDFTGTWGSAIIPSLTGASISAVTVGADSTAEWANAASTSALSDLHFSTGTMSFDTNNKLLVVRVSSAGVVQYYMINVLKATKSRVRTLAGLTLNGISANLGSPGHFGIPLTPEIVLSQFTGVRGSVTLPSLFDVEINAVKHDAAATVDWACTKEPISESAAYASSIWFDFKERLSFSNGPLSFDGPPAAAPNNILIVRVTAENGEFQYYIIDVLKPGSNSNTLNSVTVSGVRVSFSSWQESTPINNWYLGTVSIPSSADMIINAVPTDPAATVAWAPARYLEIVLASLLDNPTRLTYSPLAGALSFNTNERLLILRVTAENGTVLYYVIQIRTTTFE
ncbi:MAG: hypothetical protein LBN21_01150 [Treponema sp.]|jgi:hypothetical protein|nr:hypothetical protein [Treponema sp.]